MQIQQHDDTVAAASLDDYWIKSLPGTFLGVVCMFFQCMHGFVVMAIAKKDTATQDWICHIDNNTLVEVWTFKPSCFKLDYCAKY